MTDALPLVLLLLAAAVGVVAIFRSIGLPPIMGYLLVGTAMGPYALGWVSDSVQTRQLAEFGVVFLMFSIGLEFSLSRLYQMKRIVFLLGTAQVGGTVLVAMLGNAIIWRTLACRLGIGRGFGDVVHSDFVEIAE